MFVCLQKCPCIFKPLCSFVYLFIFFSHQIKASNTHSFASFLYYNNAFQHIQTNSFFFKTVLYFILRKNDNTFYQTPTRQHLRAFHLCLYRSCHTLAYVPFCTRRACLWDKLLRGAIVLSKNLSFVC